MKKYIFSAFIPALIFMTACKKDLSPLEQDGTIRPLSMAEEQLVESSRDFGLKLFAALNAANPDTNLFISPLSVSMALGMALNGADGDTYEAIRQTLELNGLSRQEINENYRSLAELLVSIDPKVIFENANSLWYRKGYSILSEFIETNKTYFNAEVQALDFSLPSAVDIINGWVAQKTHNMINEILDDIPPDALLYLINAIYFKALWQYQFDKNYTAEEPFNVTPSREITCPMMKVTEEFGYYEDQQVRIADLPYGNGNFSMTVLLPGEGNTADDLAASLSKIKWDYYLQNLQVRKGTVSMPKFKMEYFRNLKDVLSAMGMGVAFTGESDFSRIIAGYKIFISRVLHKTFIRVDEEGTEAAAVTLIEYRVVSSGEEDIFYLVLNRPFLFVIREKHSGAILFMGKIVRPGWEEE